MFRHRWTKTLSICVAAIQITCHSGVTRLSACPSLDEEELPEGEDLGRAGLLVRVADGLVEGVGGVVAARGSDPLEKNTAISSFE